MKYTVKQLRDKQLEKLNVVNPNVDERTTSYLMNSYYRLVGLSRTNLYLQNDERICNSEYAHKSELKEYNWFSRLKRMFYENYGLTLMYISYYPVIGFKDKNGGFKQIIEVYFY